MSSFYKRTIHPETGEAILASWLDDYFGPHQYGVKFPGEEKVYNPEETLLRTVSEPNIETIEDPSEKNICDSCQ